MTNNIQAILEEIHQAKTITIFRHINPDHDALGSQFGLATYIKSVYPNKQVIACGFHSIVKGIEYPEPIPTSEEVIEDSLAIVLDSANQERIDDQRFALAKKIIKIDHHPLVDDYGDIKWVDTTSSSTCEMVGEMLLYAQKQPLDKDVATYLLAGMLSDTIMFSIKSTTAKTLRIASQLMESSVDINQLHQKLYHISYKDFSFISFVRNKAKLVHENLLVAFIDVEDLEKFQMHPNLAKEYVYALANIFEVEVWAIFIQIKVNGHYAYNGSLRSKNTPINHIAAQYNGGGHPLACAVKHVSKQQVYEILDKIDQAIKEEQHEY